MDFPIIRRPRKRDPQWDPEHKVRAGFAYRLPPEADKETTTTTSQSEEKWIVQKYGGTCVGKFSRQIAEDIVPQGIKTHRIALVCSARSTDTKSEGTTTRLLRAARDVLDAKSRKYEDIVHAICTDHIDAGRRDIRVDDEAAGGEALLKDYEEAVQKECSSLLEILRSAQVIQEVSSPTNDKIVAVGEKLACRYMTAVLQSRGIKARYLDMSELVNGNGSKLRRPGEGYYEQMSALMRESVLAQDSDSEVCVATGFFGRVPGGLLAEIGRGYTDLCAALIGIGLKAKELQIWKEVDGVFTADPSKVAHARLLDAVSPSEAAELTFYGSEVIHNETMEQVIRAEIPIRIKNVKNPQSSGTTIVPDPNDHYHRRPGIILRERSSSNITGENQNASGGKPTAVTIKKGIAILNVHSKKRTRAHGFLAYIFSTLDNHGLSVDLISSSEVHISLALHSEARLLSGGGEEEMKIESEALKACVDDLSTLGDIDLVPNMAIISLIGRQLKRTVGIAGNFFRALAEAGVNIEMISQGASEINISCVIDAEDAEKALNVVHTNLFQFSENKN